VKDLFNQQTLKAPKLVQVNKMLYKWFTAVHSKGKNITWLKIIERVHSFYDVMKLTDQCTFSDGSNGKLPVGT
jgi:hypothetical protein